MATDGERVPESELSLETVPVASLRPHPRNYRAHPPDQIAHLARSISAHGIYRNIVVARDGTVLGGHGVLEAVRSLGLTEVPVRRMDLDPDAPEALQILVGDNTVSHLAMDDDRELSELLRDLKDSDLEDGLFGTGYDEQMLTNLVFVTRPEHEIKDLDHAAHWVGMPDYQDGEDQSRVILTFRSQADRSRAFALLGLDEKNVKRGDSTYWPPKDWDDSISLKFVG